MIFFGAILPFQGANTRLQVEANLSKSRESDDTATMKTLLFGLLFSFPSFATQESMDLAMTQGVNACGGVMAGLRSGSLKKNPKDPQDTAHQLLCKCQTALRSQRSAIRNAPPEVLHEKCGPEDGKKVKVAACDYTICAVNAAGGYDPLLKLYGVHGIDKKGAIKTFDSLQMPAGTAVLLDSKGNVIK